MDYIHADTRKQYLGKNITYLYGSKYLEGEIGNIDGDTVPDGEANAILCSFDSRPG